MMATSQQNPRVKDMTTTETDNGAVENKKILLEVKRLYSLKELTVKLERIDQATEMKIKADDTSDSDAESNINHDEQDLAELEEMFDLNEFTFSVESFSCPTCHKTYQSKSNLKYHQVHAHSKDFKHKCQVPNCSYGTTKASRLLLHMNLAHSDARPFQCEVCAKTFKSNDSLNQHQKRLHPASNVCSICRVGFVDKALLTAHEQRHSKAKNANEFLNEECHLCGAIFTCDRALKLHKRVHNRELSNLNDSGNDSASDAKFPCNYCAQSFAFKNTMRLHKQRTHFEKFRFKCDQCNYGTPTLSTMEHHKLANHSTGRPFKCPSCESCFKTPKDLNQHVKAQHPVSKDHICSECGKAFPHKAMLTRHEFRAHKKASLTETSFKRKPPEQSAKSSGDPNSFSKIHIPNNENVNEPEKSEFKCEECASIFSLQQNLVLHMKVHDENFVKNCLTCKICARVYSSEQALRRHSHKEVFTGS